MAIAIKSIPTLTKKEAETFVSKAKTKSAERATVNFSVQVQSSRSVLKKAKMRLVSRLGFLQDYCTFSAISEELLAS
jgi:hypothetical protein